MQKAKYSLIEILGEISDRRKPNQIIYEQRHVLLIVIIAVLCGMKCCLHIAYFAMRRKEWFKKLNIHKIPSHDTIGRVLNLTHFSELEAALTLWLEELLKDKHIRKRIAIDAKKVDKKSPNTTTFVRAFLTDIKMVIGGQKIPAYSNEITAIPQLIKKLNLKGYLVTIDAIGTQTKIADLLISKKADYLLPVKKNQKALYDDILLYVQSEKNDAEVFETHDSGHGRIERRRFYAFKTVKWLTERHPRWKHIKSFGLLESYRKRHNDSLSKTSRLFISSRKLYAKEFLENIRSHWTIENNLHWPLNQAFDENKIRSRSTGFIVNFSSILSFCLAVLANFKQSQISFNLQKIMLSTGGLDPISKMLCLKG